MDVWRQHRRVACLDHLAARSDGLDVLDVRSDEAEAGTYRHVGVSLVNFGCVGCEDVRSQIIVPALVILGLVLTQDLVIVEVNHGRLEEECIQDLVVQHYLQV